MAMTREELEELEGTAVAPVHTVTAEMAAAIDPNGHILIRAKQLSYNDTIEELRLEEILSAAVLAGDIDVATMAIRHGVDINLRVWNALPLHYAATRSDLDMVKLLLVHGANPNGLCSDFFTPIGYFCEFNNFSTHNDFLILRELLRHGAEPNVAIDVHQNFSIIIRSNILTIIQNQASCRFHGIVRPQPLAYDQMIDELLGFGVDLNQARRYFLANAEYKKNLAIRRLDNSRSLVQKHIDEPAPGFSPEEADIHLAQIQAEVVENEQKLVSLESLKNIGLEIFNETKLRREAKLRVIFNQGVVAGFNGMSADVANHMLLPFFRESKKDVVSARIFKLGYNKGLDKFAAEEAKKIKAAARASAVDAMAARMLVGSVPSAAANPAEPEQEQSAVGTSRASSMRP